MTGKPFFPDPTMTAAFIEQQDADCGAAQRL
jgi:hypothetical protein